MREDRNGCCNRVMLGRQDVKLELSEFRLNCMYLFIGV